MKKPGSRFFVECTECGDACLYFGHKEDDAIKTYVCGFCKEPYEYEDEHMEDEDQNQEMGSDRKRMFPWCILKCMECGEEDTIKRQENCPVVEEDGTLFRCECICAKCQREKDSEDKVVNEEFKSNVGKIPRHTILKCIKCSFSKEVNIPFNDPLFSKPLVKSVVCLNCKSENKMEEREIKCIKCDNTFFVRKEAPLSIDETFICNECKDDLIDRPLHYRGDGMDAIDVIEAFSLGFNLGNAVKYILRAGKKNDYIEDIKKAIWYLEREI